MPIAYCRKVAPALPTKKISLYIAVFLMEIGYGLFLLAASLIAVRVIPSPFVLGLTGTLHVATGSRATSCSAGYPTGSGASS